MRLVVVVEGVDRPGLLGEISSALAKYGANILVNLAYGFEGKAFLFFIVDVGRVEGLTELLESIRGVESVEYAEAGSIDAPRLIARLLQIAPGSARLIENYVEAGVLLESLLTLPPEDRVEALRALSSKTIVSMLRLRGEDIAEDLVKALGVDGLARLFSQVEADEVVDILQRLPENVRGEVVKRLPRSLRESVSSLLRYPPDTAGGIMAVEIPVARRDERVGEVVGRLGASRTSLRDTVAVVDEDGKLVGIADVGELVAAPPSARLGDVARRPPVAVSPDTRLEDLVVLVTRYGLRRIPVVDSNGRLLGIVLAEDVVDALATDYYDLLSLLEGVEPGPERYRVLPLYRLVRRRLPWLLAAYGVEALVALVVKGFEDLIARVAAVAAFAPLVMATAGNIGGQSVAMAIRALAFREVDPRRLRDSLPLLAKTLLSAIAAVAVVAVVGALYCLLLTGRSDLSLAVLVAHLATTVFSSVTGFLIPILASRLGFDPATASSPIMSTLNDVVAALTYFGLAYLLVS